ncbi:MAG: DNA replication/repair protein RecF [Eubacteriales bacterium]|nr:DNA replication/repair protein RecF [Eubacteriales bacterium]
MLLTQLRLHDFRNYHQLSFTPHNGITVIMGENGAGKTNLLEAIHLCCLGKSHRTNNDRDMIRTDFETCGVHARVMRSYGLNEVGVRIYKKNRRKKLIYVNGKIVPRIGDMMGYVTCVMFAPEDLDIIKGGPQLRRRYIDMLLSKSDPAYFFALQSYNNVLKQRNALLKTVGKGERADVLDIWDEQLSLKCAPLVERRRKAIEMLNGLAAEQYNNISGKKNETFTIEYDSQLKNSLSPAEDLYKLLSKSRADDIRRQSTSYGPHRDDISMLLLDKDMKSFASQGQIRTAALALRLSEMDILYKKHKEAPILLLDDVLSELDEIRRVRLIQCLKATQTIITCTDMDDLRGAKPDCILRAKAGVIS